MNITIKNKSIKFSSIQEGDLFIYNDKLYLKRVHNRECHTYNSCQIGNKNGGFLIAPHEDVISVQDVVVS